MTSYDHPYLTTEDTRNRPRVPDWHYARCRVCLKTVELFRVGYAEYVCEVHR